MRIVVKVDSSRLCFEAEGQSSKDSAFMVTSRMWEAAFRMLASCLWKENVRQGVEMKVVVSEQDTYRERKKK